MIAATKPTRDDLKRYIKEGRCWHGRLIDEPCRGCDDWVAEVVKRYDQPELPFSDQPMPRRAAIGKAWRGGGRLRTTALSRVGGNQNTRSAWRPNRAEGLGRSKRAGLINERPGERLPRTDHPAPTFPILRECSPASLTRRGAGVREPRSRKEGR